MNFIKHIILLLCSFIIGGCLLQEKEILIGIDNYDTSNMLLMAKEMGYLDKNFKIVRFSTRDDNNVSFYIGNVDIIYTTFFNSIYYYGKGEPGKIFYFTTISLVKDGLLLRENSKDLLGKKIGVEINNHEYYNTIIKLIPSEQLNLFKPVSLMEEEGIHLYLKGDLDGIFLHEKELNELLKEKKGFLYNNQVIESTKIEVLVAKEELLNKKPKTLIKVIDAWNKIVSLKSEDPELYKSLHEKIEKNYGYFEKDSLEVNYLTQTDNQNIRKNNLIIKTYEDYLSELNKNLEFSTLYQGVIKNED